MSKLIDEWIDVAKRQLDLVSTFDEATKQALKRAVSELDQCKETIRVRQKYIYVRQNTQQTSWLQTRMTRKSCIGHARSKRLRKGG